MGFYEPFPKCLSKMLKRVQHDKGVILVLVIPNQVLNLIQDLRFRDLGFDFNWSLTNDYFVSCFYFSFVYDFGKDSFFRHHAITCLVVDGTALMTLFSNLGHP